MKKKQTPVRHATLKWGILIKHILSLLLILATVSVLVLVLFNNLLVKNLNAYNNQNQKVILSNAADHVDHEIERVLLMVDRFMLRPELNPARMNRSPLDMAYAQAELRKLVKSASMAEECILISGREKFVISDLTSYRFDYFQDTFKSPMLNECTDFDQVYHVIRTNPTFPVEVRGKKMFALSTSYVVNGFHSETYAMFLVPQDEILKLIQNAIPESETMEGVIYLKDYYLSTFPENVTPPAWDQLEDKVKLNGRQYRVLTEERKNSCFQYAFFIDNEFYSAPVMKTTRQFFYWLTAIFLLGIVCIVIFSYYNYRPLLGLQKVLDSYLKKLPGSRQPENKQSDLNYITHGVNQLIAENMQLSSQREKDLNLLRNFCLFKLLHSPNPDQGTTQQTLINAGIYLDRELFQVISLSLWNSSDIDKFARRIKEERESQSPYFKLYYMVNGSSFVLIFNYNRKDYEMMQFLLSNFSEAYSQEIPMYMGVGSVVTGLDKLPGGYQQSQIAMHFAETRGNQEIKLYNYNDIQFNEDLEKIYNSRQVDKLLAAIRRDDRDAITRELEKLKTFVQESRFPRYAIKAMYYQIVNGILSQSGNPAAFEKGNEILMAIGDTLQKSSLSKIYEEIESLCYQMVDQTSGVVLLDKILDYINQHYADPDFSIGNMVQHFEMSHQSIGNLFKKEMHITIIEYVTKCKLAAATDMLIHTDLPIAQIVKNAGYIDNSSFTRKFKASMGMTPAEYRKNFYENKDKKPENSVKK